MTSQKEQDELRGIFGRDIEIKDLKLGELIYLKSVLDKRIKTGILKVGSNGYALDDITDLVSYDDVKCALAEGYNWRNKCYIGIDKMHVEGVLYLDCLARLNEIHVNISYIGLNPLGKV